MTEQVTQTPEQIAQETDAAMNSGFDGVRGNEAPAETPTPAPSAPTTAPASAAQPQASDSPATATETPPADAQPDSWEGVPPKVKEELQSLTSALAQSNDRLRKFEHNIGGLTSHTKELANVTKDLKAAMDAAKATTQADGNQAPSSTEVAAAIHDPAKWKQLKDDYPEWADAIEPELVDIRKQIAELAGKVPQPLDHDALKTEFLGDVDRRLADAAKTYEQTAEQRAYQARVYAYLDFKHGHGWEEKLKTKEFEDWFGKQPKETQELSKSPLATDASKMLALYEAHQKKAAEKAEREKRLDRAAQPEGVQVVASAAEDPDEAMASGFNAVRGG